MTNLIAIPLWLLLLLLGFSIWAVLDRILIPSTRWFIRRRVNRLIDDISTRLDIKIKPLQLTKRQVLIDRLVYDPKVIAAIQRYAEHTDTPRDIVQSQVFGYAREIVPSFNAYLYFRCGYWIAKRIARLLYRVRVGILDENQFQGVDPDATVVFVMNHRSNMDYILVAFLAAERTTLSYAVGEWARIWPLQTLIRAMGAFFVRRNSGNPLYRKVLERYVHMATKEGVCQAVFLEGGLSRDGCLRPPKLGFIDYMLRGFNPNSDRDIIFIPVGINYDRVLEDRSLLRMLDPEAEKRSAWFAIRTTIRFIWRSAVLMALSRWQRFGYASVNFGKPVSAKAYCVQHNVIFSNSARKERFPEVEKLCYQLLQGIATVIPVLPVSLLASIFLDLHNSALDIVELEARVNHNLQKLHQQGAPVYDTPRNLRAHTIARALNTMKMRRMVQEANGKYMAHPDARDILFYYANAIGHWKERRSEATH